MSATKDVLRPIREHKDDVATVAERDDELGALARVMLAMEQNEQPDEQDLFDAGFPIPERERT